MLKKIRLGPGADHSILGMLEWQILLVQWGHKAELQGSWSVHRVTRVRGGEVQVQALL